MKKKPMTREQSVARKKRQGGAPDLTRDKHMTKKIIADAVALGDGQPLAGWALLAQKIAIEEAERQRLLQDLPDLRAQAITALAYWTSLSRRVDALNSAKNLLSRMRAGPSPDTGSFTSPRGADT